MHRYADFEHRADTMTRVKKPRSAGLVVWGLNVSSGALRVVKDRVRRRYGAASDRGRFLRLFRHFPHRARALHRIGKRGAPRCAPVSRVGAAQVEFVD